MHTIGDDLIAMAPIPEPAALTSDARRQVLTQLKRNWVEEMHSAQLYRRLARLQPEGEARDLLSEMSQQEVKHAGHWKRRIEELGGEEPRARAGLREIALPLLARFAGLASVISLIEGGEAKGKIEYLRQARELPDARSRAIATEILPEERHHQGTAARLRIERRSDGSEIDVQSLRAHLGDIVRDLVFGLNDGLLSNFSLIAGVSGGGTSRSVILLAGVAGLLAGAASMAAGSYLSTKSRREVVQAEIDRKQEEIEYDPEQERDELRRIYHLKGFTPDETEILVRRITADRDRWLDCLITEELGLSRDAGAPPWFDAVFTGGGFAAGAFVPIIPYLVGSGAGALVSAGVLSVLALFTVGAAKSLFTARGAIRSGLEMALIGVVAAVFTNVVGRLFGHSVS